MSNDSFNILLDLILLDTLLDNSNLPLNISLSTPAQILDKSNDGVSFKQIDSHIENMKIILKKSLTK